MAKKIIVLSGKQYSGKDTVAKILLEKLTGFRRVGIGDAIKLEYSKRTGLSVEEIEKKEEFINRIIHTKHIPGYRGFVSAIKSENKFGESYGKETAESLAGTIPKGPDVPPYSRYTSTAREAYINQSAVKTQSTSELLGIGDRKITYKKPIPIDTINKYWGIDTKKNSQEGVVQKQTYESEKAERDATKASLKRNAEESREAASLFGASLYDSAANATMLTGGNPGNYSLLKPTITTSFRDTKA